MPDTIVSGWTEKKTHGNRVLEGYLGILNAGTKFGETEGRFPPFSRKKPTYKCDRSSASYFHCQRNIVSRRELGRFFSTLSSLYSRSQKPLF